ncbi:MAG: HD-GYP domain-containing protein [Lachnospiraceae bacterium]|nr:HD-GYP domain-containing protein [Lachnospiraceae bacterium]
MRSDIETRGKAFAEKKNEVPRSRYILGLILIVLLHCAATVTLPKLARSEEVLMIFGSPFPVSTFTGVLSSFNNLCMIMLVFFFRKPGFITALVLMLAQYPVMLINIFARHIYTSLPGVFTNFLTIVVIILIYQRNSQIERLRKAEIEHLTEKEKATQKLFEQTVTALVNAVDAKDTYSHGHSLRVAEYSEKLARRLNKNDDECRKIYYTALLHDIGKIGVPNHIINKKGRLDPEEFEVIKQHSVMGNSILSSIGEYPYLSIGAHYHHERFDGKGYPDGLKGNDIPEIARIISVADAYDAMSSKRSYRDIIPQQLVREEIVKGAGTQFDPVIAAEMLHMIDEDAEYRMKEKSAVSELAGRNELYCAEYRSDVSDGIQVTNIPVSIELKFAYNTTGEYKGRGPALVIFDSLDGRIHEEEKIKKELVYYEYGEVWFTGDVVNKGTRKAESIVRLHGPAPAFDNQALRTYRIKAVKCADHLLVSVDDGEKTTDITFALPDSSRYVYLSLTGEYCDIYDVSISKAEKPVAEDYIPRIAEEISYIDGPVGDIPNLQVNGHRTAATKGIKLKKDLSVCFHTMSLPTSRLIWHCPYLIIFSSKDGIAGGENYREYALLRLDGEEQTVEGRADNRFDVKINEDFGGWDAWKEENKKGFDALVKFSRNGRVITTTAENLGITMNNVTTILDGTEDIYIALTGDQCALTDIRIS